jgi:small subunit ribosomal protein S16
MLRIRLSRVGKKGHPSYRIVVAEASSPRDGAYLEWIGNYDPMADPPAITIKSDRAAHWLNLGAQPSDPVQRILDKNGIVAGMTIPDPDSGPEDSGPEDPGPEDEEEPAEAEPVEAS